MHGEVHKVHAEKVSKRARFGIPEDSNIEKQVVLTRVKDVQGEVAALKPQENVNRLNLGYDEAPFTYYT
jgi:hypothetical protein